MRLICPARGRRALCAWLLAGFTATAQAADAPRIELSFSAGVSDKPVSARLFVMTAPGAGGNPLRAANWFNPQPFFSLDVKDWKPGDTLIFDAARALGFPAPLAELPPGKYRVQAALGLAADSHEVVTAPGNGVSEIVEWTHAPAAPQPLRLTITRRLPERERTDTERVKYVRVRSRLLSEFFGRDTFMQAAVGLPDGYADDAAKHYPSVYTIPGFGGTMDAAARMVDPAPYERAGLDAVVVFLDPDCATGHHVFADSANNGPRGAALVEELIPQLEKKFRLIAQTRARFVTGHSSGGWSSLWLQIAYPDTFGGVWSTSPDPVDFRAFQTIDIYDPAQNMFNLPDGAARPISRAMGGRQILTRPFCELETVLGRGGQLQSFEAVFSPRGPDGRPMELWDRRSGALDAAVAKAWQRYDIRMIVEKNWPVLGPRLKGKLHLFCGDQDTFHLETAFFRLRDTLKSLGSDAYVEVVPGAGHGLPRAVYEKCAQQMAEQFARGRAASE